MEEIALILSTVLVVVIAILVVIYLFARKKDKEDESKKDKKISKKEIKEKLDELVSKKDDEEIDTEKEINNVEIDEETKNLGKELIKEGVMDESVLDDDLAGIDEMFLEDSDEDIEEIKDVVDKEKGDKQVKEKMGGNDSDTSLFKELEKLSKYEKKDEYNIMRDLKGKNFDLKDLKNELNSVIKEINKVKRKKSTRR
ncbi:MAG: hypothetical protein EF806_05460 [Candidatus Methanoliparum thermophilum]|uniref:Uncharacterized protein n=1 Tax=Methanoliparum thermophilum TaxID=2491083 RepID=A0A520KR23_METT2|nr:hypothetical protein [Candidatus Methanoliparum sp. LAM-1]RZN64068.1 MAG: hypothetical protein EF806_05460 [Candidatus Methanoliparum thermophilum]BDC35675.1 hypothetical protein MTLP_03570 [Candidatus Methanoliparum sp. LAM-1]